MASMLNKYFSSVFSTTSGVDNINTKDIYTNGITNSDLVENQDATTVLSDNSNDINNKENSLGLDQQNYVHDHVISSEHTLQNSEITTEDVLNTLIN